MKKISSLLPGIFLALAPFAGSAQISYTFTATTGTYTANATPTVLHGEGIDFGISPLTNIGFSFVFGGTTYTQFRATPDGYITFNASAWGSGWNDLNFSSERPIIAPLWDDMMTNTAGGTANDGTVNYKLTGTAPNRVLTVEWKKMNWSYSSGNPVISFQAKLYETTNIIDFIYLQEATAVNFGSASIGLAGICSGDYYSLNGTSASPVASKTTETTNIATKPATGQIYRWTPSTAVLTNDLCSGAIVLPYSLGSCSATAGTVIGATATGSPAAPACWSPATTSHDVWYTVTKPAGQTGMVVSTDNVATACNSFGTAFSVYSGSCAALTMIGCADAGGTLNPNNAVLTLSGLPSAATTYWIRVEGDGTTTGNFQICVRDPLCPSSLGTGVTSIAALPYNVTGATTCGMIDNLTSGNTTVCGSSWYTTAEDAVYTFTPTVSGSITATLTSTSSYVGITLYNGCPLIGGGGACVASSQSYLGNQSFCATVTAGTMYYLVVDQWASPYCIPSYDLSITAPAGIPTGTTCANPVVIASLPYTAIGENTACMGNDYTNATTGSCASLYESGEDKVYQYVAAASECIGITLSNSSTWSIGFQVYSGCPGAGGTCIGSYGGSNPLSGSIVLPSAGTYYIMVDTWASPSSATYDISITSFGSGPANDLPCNATLMTVGTSLSADNSCSGGSGEPATPVCWWSPGNLNTIWFKVVCPASGQLLITTTLGSLTNTQMAVYSGACGSLTEIGCNDDDATSCSSTSYNSGLSLSGLTPGSTYYISVDGYSNSVGSFSIIANDGAVPPAGTIQDCSGAIAVCSSVITQSVSYFGCGNITDIPPVGSYGNPNVNPNCCNSGCQLAGELNDIWYHITIGSNGFLEWQLTPAVTGYYDWSLYPLTSNTCEDIANNLVAPVSCNWNATSTGGTGMMSPVPAGGSAGNYEAPLAVTAGQQFGLHLSNYSGTSGGLTLDFSSSTAGISAPTTLSWTGSTSTAWAVAGNWGNCTPPTCTINAYVGAATNQPVISVNTNVKDLTIASGATLTVNAGVTLTICGDFINYGNLVISPTSTILFNNGAVVHNITGNFTGANKLGNVTITKTGGSVIANNDLDIAGTFTTSNATSIFNSNGKYIRLGGHFMNSSGGTTYINCGTTGTLEFNGAAAQNYSAGGTLTLNHVVMNHTGTGVTLVGNNMLLGTSGVLTLTAGKIITGALEVRVNNTASAAVTPGNNSSYVQGFLRRYINSTGSYDFPVGHATPGYERANVNFTAATTISNLLASFNPYGSVPAALGSTECAVTYNLPALDDGRWTINAYNATLTQITGTGTYTMTLYNRPGSYTNGGSSTAWTVMKDPGTGWTLNGTCAASTIGTVVRTGMSGFSNFGTAQSMTPLPIELISFTGKNLGKVNQLDWTTSSEINNDFFTLEHSAEGSMFDEIAVVDGAGNSSHNIDYSALDNAPFDGRTYYRLRQTDFDGHVTHSPVIIIENHLDEISLNNIHPNPTSNALNFDFYTPVKGKIHVVVFNSFGQLVFDEYREVAEGKTEISAQLEMLSNGIYSMKVTMEDTRFFSVNKIIKY